MYSFFILGQIPGTSITISFSMWLFVCLLATSAYLAVRVHRYKLTTSLALEPTIGSDEQVATAH